MQIHPITKKIKGKNIMTIKKKQLSYGGYKNILNRVAYKLIKQNKAYKHGNEYTVNGKKKTYKEIIALIKKNGTNYGKDPHITAFMEDVINKTDKTLLPGYVMGESGVNKYNRASYRALAKKVQEYRRKNNGKNPKEITATYERIDKLYNYLTKQGCSGMGQCTPYYCACNSLQQSFYRLTGIKVSENTIAKWCGTTTDGTSHEGIETGVAMFNKKYGKNVKIKWYYFSELSWSKIAELMKKGAVFFHLKYRNQWGHYEIIKSVGDDLKILNSLGDRCGGLTYCGYIETRTKSEQKSYISGISQKSVAYLYNG